MQMIASTFQAFTASNLCKQGLEVTKASKGRAINACSENHNGITYTLKIIIKFEVMRNYSARYELFTGSFSENSLFQYNKLFPSDK